MSDPAQCLVTMKHFTDADVEMTNGGTYSTEKGWSEQYVRINCDESELVRDEPNWMKQGLQETASGYGARLNSGLKINFNGKMYRVYITIYSNNGTAWFLAKGRKIIVG